MNRFQSGNVVKDPYGNIVIIYRNDGVYTTWVSFDSDSVGISLNDDILQKEDQCSICVEPEKATKDCPDCKGVFNNYYHTKKGFNQSTLLATSVKSYILERLTQNFDF